MATVTKRIAKSGLTIDGRELPKPTLLAMAASYDQQTYAARINMEHIVAMWPDSTFKEYGTVTALRTEEAPANEVYLVADMEVLDEVIDFWENKKQKRAFSIELDRNLVGSGKPYLTGLAITSTPASLGTHFSATSPNVIRYQFIERRVDDHADYTVEHLSMSIDTPAGNPATPPKTEPTTPASNVPDQFAAHLQHFTTELAAVRDERNAAQAECKRLTDEFTAKLAAKDSEYANALSAKTSEYTGVLAAKDAEIESLKQQIPADGYQFRPKFTGNEDAKAATGGFRF
ncbi:Phage capsid scaffolding protein (GPO) serine peptidase [Thiothrix eikelboomii]|uniref:Phage capsid scaffolding protein (GPO) serine peptidase n=1 Tax=Thiothrix eikelboomii TaxID=92487 RepID=A0A1T4WV54_9GAMM|nr:GPO family capsid scaffolding protein [Thiothrix eikelboomii]SKA81184.1 Phage capsid scaffolding protein (GPO) serine peptidase [Thiothrix eikelboomii]